MALDVVDLREFYISPLGRLVRGLLRVRLGRIWPDLKGEALLAIGYATPLLRPWLGKANRILAVMSAEQGVAYWPREGPNVSCLADLSNLPLPDESVERVILLHALENAPDPEELLREAWRVLKPQGRMLVIVPNRRGMWAHTDTTPFGSGQPYTSGQLRAALRKQDFLIERSWQALYMPPHQSRFLRALAWPLEKIGACLPQAFGGVLLVEGSKQIYTPAMVKARAKKRRLVLPLPFPSTPGAMPT